VIARLDEAGNELGWVRIDNDPKTLVAECRKAGRGAAVAIEATYGWYWAVDALHAAKFDAHLAHPSGMKALRKRKRVKTDPRDAYELATLLRLGSLPEAYIAPPDLRELRELVRHRRQLVKLATSIKGGVRALLAKHNIRLAASDLDGDMAVALMDALELPGTYATRLASQRRLLMVLADEIASVEVDLHTRLRHHPGYCNLLKVKSIGPILAAVFVAEIGDVTRFPTAAALSCWAGLTPRHYESDKTVHRRRRQSAPTTRRPQHRSSSRSALRALRVDPAPHSTLPNNRRHRPEQRSEREDLTAPLRLGMALWNAAV
jgi:transposase